MPPPVRLHAVLGKAARTEPGHSQDKDWARTVFKLAGKADQASNRPTYRKCLRAISVFRQHGHNNGRQNTAAGKTFLKTFKNRHSKDLANGLR